MAVLGVTPASADVTWLAELFPGGPASTVKLVAGGSITAFSGAPALQSETVNNQGSSSTMSAATATGFTGGFQNGQNGVMEVNAFRILQLTAPVNVQASLSLGDVGRIKFDIIDASNFQSVGKYQADNSNRSGVAYTSSLFTLNPGTYGVEMLVTDVTDTMPDFSHTNSSGSFSFSIAPVPEPGTIGLAVCGIAAAGCGLWRRRRQAGRRGGGS